MPIPVQHASLKAVSRTWLPYLPSPVGRLYLSLSLARACSLSRSRSVSLLLSLFLARSLARPIALSVSLFPALALALPLFLPFPLARARSLSAPACAQGERKMLEYVGNLWRAKLDNSTNMTNYMLSEIHPEILQENLVELNLDFNFICVIPVEIGKLKKLEDFSIIKNRCVCTALHCLHGVHVCV